MAVSGSPCLVSSCKISHFGMNPVSGGKPASDNIVTRFTVVMTGAFVQLVARILIFVADIVFSVMKAVYVMMI